MMGYGAGLGFGLGGFLGLLGCVFLVVGAVVLIAWAIDRARGGADAPSRTPAGGDALEILKLRFARGEITADEFTAAKQILEAGR